MGFLLESPVQLADSQVLHLSTPWGALQWWVKFGSRLTEGGECSFFGECGVVAEEGEAAGLVRHREHLQQEPAEQARKHADGEEESGPARDPALALERDATTRHDHVHVRMMGGDVTVTSEPGKGSVFTVRLPAGTDA
jgi:hypothetical protein